MSAVLTNFMDRRPASQDQQRRDAMPEEEDDESASFWPWFAIGMLLFCWIAEASMCAERGF